MNISQIGNCSPFSGKRVVCPPISNRDRKIQKIAHSAVSPLRECLPNDLDPLGLRLSDKESSALHNQVQNIETEIAKRELIQRLSLRREMRVILRQPPESFAKIMAELGVFAYYLAQEHMSDHLCSSRIGHWIQDVEKITSEMPSDEQIAHFLRSFTELIILDDNQINRGGSYTIQYLLQRTPFGLYFSDEHRNQILSVMDKFLVEGWEFGFFHDLPREIEFLIRVELKRVSTESLTSANINRVLLLALLFDLHQISQEKNCTAVSTLKYLIHEDPKRVISFLVEIFTQAQFTLRDMRSFPIVPVIKELFSVSRGVSISNLTQITELPLQLDAGHVSEEIEAAEQTNFVQRLLINIMQFYAVSNNGICWDFINDLLKPRLLHYCDEKDRAHLHLFFSKLFETCAFRVKLGNPRGLSIFDNHLQLISIQHSKYMEISTFEELEKMLKFLIMEMASEGICSLDFSGRIVEALSQLCSSSLFMDELQKKCLDSVRDADDQQMVQKAIQGHGTLFLPFRERAYFGIFIKAFGLSTASLNHRQSASIDSFLVGIAEIVTNLLVAGVKQRSIFMAALQIPGFTSHAFIFSPRLSLFLWKGMPKILDTHIYDRAQALLSGGLSASRKEEMLFALNLDQSLEQECYENNDISAREFKHQVLRTLDQTQHSEFLESFDDTIQAVEAGDFLTDENLLHMLGALGIDISASDLKRIQTQLRKGLSINDVHFEVYFHSLVLAEVLRKAIVEVLEKYSIVEISEIDRLIREKYLLPAHFDLGDLNYAEGIHHERMLVKYDFVEEKLQFYHGIRNQDFLDKETKKLQEGIGIQSWLLTGVSANPRTEPQLSSQLFS